MKNYTVEPSGLEFRKDSALKIMSTSGHIVPNYSLEFVINLISFVFRLNRTKDPILRRHTDCDLPYCLYD